MFKAVRNPHQLTLASIDVLLYMYMTQGSDGKLVALQSVNNQTCEYDLYDQHLFRQGRQTIQEDIGGFLP